MPKYQIIPGSIDVNDMSVGTHDGNYKDIKYLQGDFNAVAKTIKSNGLNTFEEAVSLQREKIEAGKPAIMKDVLG